MSDSAEKDALLRVLNDHAWERSVYTDHAPPHASIGKWGWRCPCGEVVKGESAHREHLAEAIIAARVIPPGVKVGYHPCVGCGNLVPPDVEWCGGCPIPPALPLHRTEAGYPRCSTCDGGGCLDCTDPA